MPFLELQDVSYAYPGGGTALDHQSLSIEKGEKIAIIGENGAGKSTLSKLMNGLLRPTSGRILLEGEDTNRLSSARIARKIGYVFQNPDEQIFNRDVHSEIVYTPKYDRLGEEETDRRLKKALRLTGMEKHEFDNPYDLSYSLRKFVTIAVVLAMETDVVILDEPTAGQDVFGMRRLSSLIDSLVLENRTVVVITHDMEFTAKNFSRILAMAEHRIIADAAVRDIFWNFDILHRAALDQPYVSRLAKRLGMHGRAVIVQDFVEDAWREKEEMRK